MEDLKARLIAELDKRRVLSLATLRPDGWPQVTIVGYVNDGLMLYFVVAREGQKYTNLKADPRASICIGEDVADPMSIAGASMAVTVAEVADPVEKARAMALMFKRYPEYEAMMEGADVSGMSFMRATPFVASVLNYKKGFGHSDMVTLGERPTIAVT